MKWESHTAVDHEGLVQEVKTLSESIELKYDDKIAKLTPEKDDTPNPTVALLNEKYLELKDRISTGRKEGKDVFVPEFILKGVPPRLAMAKATREREDVKKAESILNDASKELEKALKEVPLDIRKEIDAKRQEEKVKEEPKEKVKEVQEAVKEKVEEIRAQDRTVRRGFRYFYCENGDVYRTLKELSQGLRLMSQKDFDFHTKREYNDFARWLEGVFNENQLAEKIKGIENKDEMADIIEKAITKEVENVREE